MTPRLLLIGLGWCQTFIFVLFLIQNKHTGKGRLKAQPREILECVSDVVTQVFMQQNKDYQCLKVGTGRRQEHSSSQHRSSHMGKAAQNETSPPNTEPKSPGLSSSVFHTCLLAEWVSQLQKMDLTGSLLVPAKQRDPLSALCFQPPISSSHRADNPSSGTTFQHVQLGFRAVSQTASSISATLPAYPGLLSFTALNSDKWIF